MLHRLVPLLLLPCLLGCEQRVDGGGDSSFLRLQAFSLVEPQDGRLRGFVRWMFTADDPSTATDPDTSCETWEELDLLAVAISADCAGCEVQFEGTATPQEAETTCSDVTWGRRSFALGFGPLPADDPDLATLVDEGYTHQVQSRWSPDLGDSDSFSPQFAAKPKEWEPDQGGGPGSGAGEVLSGQHELTGLYYWEL